MVNRLKEILAAYKNEGATYDGSGAFDKNKNLKSSAISLHQGSGIYTNYLIDFYKKTVEPALAALSNLRNKIGFISIFKGSNY